MSQAVLRAVGLATGLLSALLLAGNTALALKGSDFAELTPPGRRYRLPIAAAVGRYLDAEFPAARVKAAPPDAMDEYQERMAAAVAEAGIRPWQFWRTIPAAPFLEDRVSFVVRPFEDPGRVVLLAAGFRALRGIAPYLHFWLGALLCLPLLVWTAVELFDAGRPISGVVFPALVASSAYVVGALRLTYSSAGFYLAGLLLLVPWTVYAILGRCRSRPLFAVRLALAAGFFAACALARSGTLFLLGGFLVATVIAVLRLFQDVGSRARRLALCLAAGALFVAPYALLREPQHHDIWLSLWLGLGDFDRVKGHYWSDSEAKKVVRSYGEEWNGPRSEEIFRRLTTAHVREDPLWYGAILGRRACATVSQRKLWPWGPRGGRSMEPRDRPNEGAIDDYYNLTPTADWFVVAARRMEAPVTLLLLPTWLLALTWAALRMAGTCGEACRGAGRCLAVLGVLGICALGVPVLVTTAGAIETEAFVLVYFLGLAFALDEAAAAIKGRRRATAGPGGSVAA